MDKYLQIITVQGHLESDTIEKGALPHFIHLKKKYYIILHVNKKSCPWLLLRRVFFTLSFIPHLAFFCSVSLPPQTPAHHYVETLNKWPANEGLFSRVLRGGRRTETQMLKVERVEDHSATHRARCYPHVLFVCTPVRTRTV